MSELDLVAFGWTEVEPNKWMKKNSFIDMQGGGNYMDKEGAIELQTILNEWENENE